MSRQLHVTIGAALLCCVPLSSYPQTTPPASANAVAKSLGLIIYPAKGQAAEQQTTDEQQCYDWAKAQTGIDPQAPPPPAESADSKSAGGQRVKGAARGAAAGAIIGEVADNDADEGAKIGAAAGVVSGGRKARQEKRSTEEQAKTDAQAAQTQRTETFKKAMGTCLQGRGYTTG
jgi:uncharacterized protein YcfJ